MNRFLAIVLFLVASYSAHGQASDSTPATNAEVELRRLELEKLQVLGPQTLDSIRREIASVQARIVETDLDLSKMNARREALLVNIEEEEKRRDAERAVIEEKLAGVKQKRELVQNELGKTAERVDAGELPAQDLTQLKLLLVRLNEDLTELDFKLPRGRSRFQDMLTDLDIELAEVNAARQFLEQRLEILQPTLDVAVEFERQRISILSRSSKNDVPMATDGGESSPDFAGENAGDEKDLDGVELVWCPPGQYTMGSPRNEPERRHGEDQVEITLTRGFWMGKYEVTQGLWSRVMGWIPEELDRGAGSRFPIYNVNFGEAEEFCRRLTELLQSHGALPAGWEVRLPTEAQWEYACRAGTTTATAFGDTLSSTQANFLGHTPYNGGAEGPALDRAVEVGSYAPNAWGLYDMHGNEFEWCRDWYHSRHPGGIDPDLHDVEGTPNEGGSLSRVRKGGCWADVGWPLRSAFRLRFEPERGHSHIGFRLVIVQT